MCVEIDLTKPLKAGYRIKGKLRWLQYGGLHQICFECGKYGHRSTACQKSDEPTRSPTVEDNKCGQNANCPVTEDQGSTFGPWLLAKRPKRRAGKSSAIIVHESNHLRLSEQSQKSSASEDNTNRFILLAADDQATEIPQQPTIAGGRKSGEPSGSKPNRAGSSCKSVAATSGTLSKLASSFSTNLSHQSSRRAVDITSTTQAEAVEVSGVRTDARRELDITSANQNKAVEISRLKLDVAREEATGCPQAVDGGGSVRPERNKEKESPVVNTSGIKNDPKNSSMGQDIESWPFTKTDKWKGA